MTEYLGDMHEDYPTQRRLVAALDDHDIYVHWIRTRNDAVRLQIPIEDARRLIDILKEQKP